MSKLIVLTGEAGGGKTTSVKDDLYERHEDFCEDVSIVLSFHNEYVADCRSKDGLNYYVELETNISKMDIFVLLEFCRKQNIKYLNINIDYRISASDYYNLIEDFIICIQGMPEQSYYLYVEEIDRCLDEGIGLEEILHILKQSKRNNNINVEVLTQKSLNSFNSEMLNMAAKKYGVGIVYGEVGIL